MRGAYGPSDVDDLDKAVREHGSWRETRLVDVPEVRFADASGVSIAWQQFGHGPDLVIVPPLVTNIEINWEHEYYRRFLEHLGRHLRVTVFDKRGVGMSDRFAEAPTLEQRTEDLLAVLDAAGLDTVAVAGASEGGLMAQLFAAQHPERVERLVLINSLPGISGFLAIHQAPDGSFAPLEAKMEKFRRLVETWGRDPQFMVDWFTPCYAEDAAFVRWVGRLQRQSATATDLDRQIESMVILDAVDHLSAIVAPTLIMHGTDDQVVPVSAAHYLGERIAGSTVLELPIDDHFAFTHPGWRDHVDQFIGFVAGSPPTRQPERRVQTIVFTDIVGSTSGAAAAGDGAWHRVLDHHDRVSWETAARHGGTIVKNTGDGVLARFDAPSSAIVFARDLREALGAAGLRLRCGVHTGEVELRDNGDITGVAVNLAARIEQAGDEGAIFVSSTVCDLLLGGDARFEDRGEHQLKGVDRPWRLFSLVTG
jgi:class 3 adenylate cyclase/pimeloyl-ACP methyl ester carboxylesterase